MKFFVNVIRNCFDGVQLFARFQSHGRGLEDLFQDGLLHVSEGDRISTGAEQVRRRQDITLFFFRSIPIVDEDQCLGFLGTRKSKLRCNTRVVGVLESVENALRIILLGLASQGDHDFIRDIHVGILIEVMLIR